MILGLQPSHFRFCWHQSQQHEAGHPYYLHNTLLEEGCVSIARNESQVLDAIEPSTFHHFEMYLVAGPYVQSGFYRWAFNENFTQLAARKSWQVLSGPHAASFKNYFGSGSSSYFRDLRLHTEADAPVGSADHWIRINKAYAPVNSKDWFSLVCVMRGFPDLNDYRPLMVIEYAPAQAFPEAQKLYLTQVDLSLYSQYPNQERVRHTPYRGRSQYTVGV